MLASIKFRESKIFTNLSHVNCSRKMFKIKYLAKLSSFTKKISRYDESEPSLRIVSPVIVNTFCLSAGGVAWPVVAICT